MSLISIKRPFEREMEHSITFDASGAWLRPYPKLKKKGNILKEIIFPSINKRAGIINKAE